MKISCVKTGNVLLESMFGDIGAELLLEGHSEEQLNVEKDIEQQAADPKDDQGNKFEPTKFPPDKRIAKVKITASKDSFTVKIV